jgi:DNA-binding NarL/FixJ family response regulator
MLVHASLLAGRPADASAALEGLDTATRDKSWPEAHARTCMAAGRVSLVAGDLDAARLSLEDAVAAFLHLGMPYDAAVARLALAGAVANHPELAASEAGGALDVFEHLGAQPGADAAAAFLRAHGRATRPGPRGLGLLTMREQEVLALLRSGLSNPEIADRLVISRKTAAHHVSSLLSKLGVRNRAEAVAFASRQPVTSPP